MCFKAGVCGVEVGQRSYILSSGQLNGFRSVGECSAKLRWMQRRGLHCGQKKVYNKMWVEFKDRRLLQFEGVRSFWTVRKL